MNSLEKPYIHVPIDAVDTVAYDPKGRFDPEHYDRYATFEDARNAALTSIELMLDERDYDGEDHRAELEAMLALLEKARSFKQLMRHPEYRRLMEGLKPSTSYAA